MKIILWILTVILFILCLHVNVLTSLVQLKDSVIFYKNIHFFYLVFFLLLSFIIYLRINQQQPTSKLPNKTTSYKPGASKKVKPAAGIGGPQSKRGILWLTGILCAGFILRTIIAVTFPGNPYDIQAFIHWSAAAARNLSGIYFDPSIPSQYTLTYPPVYLYVLSFLGKVIRFFLVESYSILLIILKLPSIITDIVTGYLLYRFSKKHLSQNMSLFIAGLYIFNPVAIFNSALWGQVDSFLTLFIMMGLLLIDAGQLPWASALFVLAILTKPQGVFVLPVLIWELWRRKKAKDFLWSALGRGNNFRIGHFAVFNGTGAVLDCPAIHQNRWAVSLCLR